MAKKNAPQTAQNAAAKPWTNDQVELAFDFLMDTSERLHLGHRPAQQAHASGQQLRSFIRAPALLTIPVAWVAGNIWAAQAQDPSYENLKYGAMAVAGAALAYNVAVNVKYDTTQDIVKDAQHYVGKDPSNGQKIASGALMDLAKFADTDRRVVPEKLDRDNLMPRLYRGEQAVRDNVNRKHTIGMGTTFMMGLSAGLAMNEMAGPDDTSRLWGWVVAAAVTGYAMFKQVKAHVQEIKFLDNLKTIIDEQANSPEPFTNRGHTREFEKPHQMMGYQAPPQRGRRP